MKGRRVEVDFDVIVVGAGIAGSITALQLARAGLEVALVERGDTPGSKNLSGGVFYCDVMTEVFPNFAAVAPIERRITRNNLTFLTPTGHVGLDIADRTLVEPANAVSVRRAVLDPWLAEQAEDAGVAVVPGMLVDRVLTEDGRVCGVAVGEDELRCRVVVAADGINSFVARSIGLRRRAANKHLAVGVKSVIALDADTINSRFQVGPGEGAAWAMVGEATRGVAGGGFLYTNTDTISVGVVLRLDSLLESGLAAADIHDHFLAHPSVAPYLAGGHLKEYGCHMTAEGGRAMLGEIVTDGLVVVGDAAGLTINQGYAIRGMDLAAGSALAAARAICEALAADDCSAAGLGAYRNYLAESFVGRDLDTFAGTPDLFEEDGLYRSVGPLLADLGTRLYRHDTTPHPPVRRIVREALVASDLSLADLARLGWKGATRL